MIDRRSFLMRSAAVGVGAIVAPSSLLAQVPQKPNLLTGLVSVYNPAGACTYLRAVAAEPLIKGQFVYLDKKCGRVRMSKSESLYEDEIPLGVSVSSTEIMIPGVIFPSGKEEKSWFNNCYDL